MYSNLPGQIISKHGYQVTARKRSLLCFGYHTQYQPCKAELNLKILVTFSILICFFFQGCLANLDVGGDTSHPIKNALVPSKHVSDGCGGKYQKLKR